MGGRSPPWRERSAPLVLQLISASRINSTNANFFISRPKRKIYYLVILLDQNIKFSYEYYIIHPPNLNRIMLKECFFSVLSIIVFEKEYKYKYKYIKY